MIPNLERSKSLGKIAYRGSTEWQQNYLQEKVPLEDPPDSHCYVGDFSRTSDWNNLNSPIIGDQGLVWLKSECQISSDSNLPTEFLTEETLSRNSQPNYTMTLGREYLELKCTEISILEKSATLKNQTKKFQGLSVRNREIQEPGWWCTPDVCGITVSARQL